MVLFVGAKLQLIITCLAREVRTNVEINPICKDMQLCKKRDLKKMASVHPRDELFWFSSPRLLLFLVHFILFQVIISDSSSYQLLFGWLKAYNNFCRNEHGLLWLHRFPNGTLKMITWNFPDYPFMSIELIASVPVVYFPECLWTCFLLLDFGKFLAHFERRETYL